MVDDMKNVPDPFNSKRVKKSYHFNDLFERLFLFWTGIIAFGFSVLLLIGMTVCYLLKPDAFAALTFFPAWGWGVAGLIISFGSLLYKRRICFALLSGWLLFIFIYAEEPVSLFRAIHCPFSKWQKLPAQKKVVVISLNCAGGNMEAVREIAPYSPDIVLLQEVPSSKDEILSFAESLFGDDAGVAHGADTAIIVRGKLEEVSLGKPKNIFMTQARITLSSGFETEVICLRLKPPEIGVNILSPSCWANHERDRESRRKQIDQIVEQFDNFSDTIPIIVGGDFNVPARDGCMEALKPFVSDTFVKGGVGWGHTAINSLPLFRVDQIWASSECNPVAVFARETKHSDHRMVICYLEIESEN